jgi:hypothetical protein
MEVLIDKLIDYIASESERRGISKELIAKELIVRFEIEEEKIIEEAEKLQIP